MYKKPDEEYSYKLISMVDRINQPKHLVVLFLIGLVGNTASWLFGIFAPEKLYNFMSSFRPPIDSVMFYYFLFLPFVFGFLMGLSAIKIFYARKNQVIVEKTDFLNGYSSHLQRENTRFSYFFAGIAGSLNCILITFFSVISYRLSIPINL